MQTIRADDQIELPQALSFERHLHVVDRLVDVRDRVAEERFDSAVKCTVNRSRKIAAGETRESAAYRSSEGIRREYRTLCDPCGPGTLTSRTR